MGEIGDVGAVNGDDSVAYVQPLTPVCRTVLDDAPNEGAVAAADNHKAKALVVVAVQCDVVGVEVPIVCVFLDEQTNKSRWLEFKPDSH